MLANDAEQGAGWNARARDWMHMVTTDPSLLHEDSGVLVFGIDGDVLVLVDDTDPTASDRAADAAGRWWAPFGQLMLDDRLADTLIWECATR